MIPPERSRRGAPGLGTAAARSVACDLRKCHSSGTHDAAEARSAALSWSWNAAECLRCREEVPGLLWADADTSAIPLSLCATQSEGCCLPCRNDGSVQPHAQIVRLWAWPAAPLTGTRWLGELHGLGGVFFVLHIQLKVGFVYTSTCRYTKHPSLPDVRARQPATPPPNFRTAADARTPRQYSRVPAPAATCAGCAHRATAVSWLAVIIEGCGGFRRGL